MFYELLNLAAKAVWVIFLLYFVFSLKYLEKSSNP